LSKRQFEGSGSNCQLSHIIPKFAQQVLSKEQDVVNNPDNIIPTFSIVHEQMELKNATPNLSFKFKEHQGEFDLYELVFSSSITHDNILLKIMSPGDNVLQHQSSFMFLQVHKRVFDSYSMLRAGNIETTHALCLGNLVTSYVLFSGAQRFLNERNKGLIEKAKAEEKAGRKLKKRKLKLSRYKAELLRFSSGKFEFVLVDECNTEQLGWLRASYKGRLSKAAARGMPAIYRIALTVLAGHLLEPGR
jgi:hypothetical protein